jgi:aryl-phospho-beta-D-glucosidase BglC (GH1 family)
MAKYLKWLIIIVFFFIIIITIVILTAVFSENGKILLPVKHKEVFVPDNNTNYPLSVKVKENRIINSNGKSIIFKGLMPADPSRLHNINKFNKKFFEKIKRTGANIIRIPVHPESWVNDEDYLWRYLDPIVEWAGELNMYVIIDWHYIGNISNGEGQNMPDIDIPPRKLTSSFWNKISNYFKDAQHVLFEIYNEPADISKNEWIKVANEIISTIRSNGANQIIIVGGVQYGKNISWARENKIKDNNIVYASHIYPAHKENTWDYYFGKISKIYPVLITEWGFIDDNNKRTNKYYLKGNSEDYGEPLVKYLQEHNIGWIACWYDNKWEPKIFKEDFNHLTNYGAFIINHLNN